MASQRDPADGHAQLKRVRSLIGAPVCGSVIRGATAGGKGKERFLMICDATEPETVHLYTLDVMARTVVFSDPISHRPVVCHLQPVKSRVVPKNLTPSIVYTDDDGSFTLLAN
eukprot:248567_1